MGANTTFSQEELDAMSEEERQAVEEELQGDTDTDEDPEGETETGGNEGEEAGKAAEEAEEEETGEEDQEGGDQDAGETDSDDQVTDQEGQGEPVQTDNQEQQAPQRQPADQTQQSDQIQDGDQAGEQADPHAEKKQEFQDKLTQLKEQFEEGEISFEDYLDQRDEAKDQLRELELTTKVRQELEEDRKKQQQAQLEQQWKQDQQAFFDANKDIQKDPELLKAFQQQANIKIQDSAWDSVSNTELLKQAAQEARAIRGVSAPDPKQQQTEAAKARQRANKKAGDKSVDTLSGVPSAAEHEDADSEFAHLDKLMEQGKAEKLEAELAKLSPEEEARYLQR